MKTLEIPYLKPGVKIHIIRGDIRKEHEKLRKQGVTEHSLHRHANAVTVRNCPDYYILLRKSPEISSRAHEALHVVEDICRRYNVDDEEFKAYLLGWITEQS